MDSSKQFKTFIRLYWVRITVISSLVLLLIGLIILLILSVDAWNNMESFYKKQVHASIWLQLYISLLSGLMFGAIYTYMWNWMMFRGGGYGSLSKLQTKAVKGVEIGVKWKDIIGMEDIKREAWEAVELIRERFALKRIGGQILRGVLLVGPPGVGKTYLAKGIATECNMPFLSVIGSELEGVIVGLGAQKIRKLFKYARDLAEIHGGCIIFIDEVDSVARPRRAGIGMGGAESYNMAVNQLLAEMDGLRSKEYNIVVIAATNVSENELDPALMRAGRFDRKIYIGLPNLEDRDALFRFYLNNVYYDKQNIRFDHLARLTVGSTPADISNIVREASLIAVRNKKSIITMKEITEARERTTLGLKRIVKYSAKEREKVSYHEAGHVVVTYLAVPFKDVFKATIIPRGYSGGSTWTPEKEAIEVRDKNHLLCTIKGYLGGYVAEKIKYGITSVGVSDDFKHATDIAYKMVWNYGMGKSEYIGDFSSLTTEGHRYLSFASELDKDANEILKESIRETEELLRKNWDIVEIIVKQLIEKDELNYDEIEAIFNDFKKGSSQNTSLS